MASGSHGMSGVVTSTPTGCISSYASAVDPANLLVSTSVWPDTQYCAQTCVNQPGRLSFAYDITNTTTCNLHSASVSASLPTSEDAATADTFAYFDASCYAASCFPACSCTTANPAPPASSSCGVYALESPSTTAYTSFGWCGEGMQWRCAAGCQSDAECGSYATDGVACYLYNEDADTVAEQDGGVVYDYEAEGAPPSNQVKGSGSPVLLIDVECSILYGYSGG